MMEMNRGGCQGTKPLREMQKGSEGNQAGEEGKTEMKTDKWENQTLRGDKATVLDFC